MYSAKRHSPRQWISFAIMGYDYYYTGSSEAGPVDPLYGFFEFLLIVHCHAV